MMLLKIEGFEGPIIGFSYSTTEQTNMGRLDPGMLSAMAGGFVTLILNEAVVEENKVAGLIDPEQLTILEAHIGKPVICVDVDNLNKWPMNEFLAMLHHEKGHLVFRHLEQNEGVRGLILKEEYELEADAYAATMVGKKILRKALMRAIFQCHKRTFKKGWFKTALYTLLSIGGEQKYRFKALK